jgi:hypothetical protein
MIPRIFQLGTGIHATLVFKAILAGGGQAFIKFGKLPIHLEYLLCSKQPAYPESIRQKLQDPRKG